MSTDVINIITYLVIAIIAAIFIAGGVGLIKLIILWWEVRMWRKWRNKE